MGSELSWQSAGTDWGGLAGVCMGGTVQILIAENRQLALPYWCRVAPVHREQIVMRVAAVMSGGGLGRKCYQLLICVCIQAHMFSFG